jgi:hypothetical protein
MFFVFPPLCAKMRSMHLEHDPNAPAAPLIFFDEFLRVDTPDRHDNRAYRANARKRRVKEFSSSLNLADSLTPPHRITRLDLGRSPIEKDQSPTASG